MNLNKIKTDDQKWQLWGDALSGEGLILKETLIKENIDYLKWNREQVLSRWGEKGTEKTKEKWEIEKPKTEKEIKNYYNTLRLYIPELSSWHALSKNIALMKIIDFMLLCKKNKKKIFLDYGGGIGSNVIFFNHYGFNSTLADISNEMLNYSKWRIKRHMKNVDFIDLKEKSLPINAFDCATCIEVLEHLIDPLSAMKKIHKSLKIKGLILITTPFYKDEKRPQHLVHDMRIADKFNDLGFKIFSINKDKMFRVLEKTK